MARLPRKLRALWMFHRNRISFWRWWWWRPLLTRHELASGPYGGWHFTWGPFHVWSVTTHNRTTDKGWGWS